MSDVLSWHDYREACACDRCVDIYRKRQAIQDEINTAELAVKCGGVVSAQKMHENITKLWNDSNTKKDDPVNHPKHYCQHPSGIECIEITRHYNFDIGNAIKYLWRNGLKDGESDIQDLKKAIWYINDEISQREKCATRATKEK